MSVELAREARAGRRARRGDPRETCATFSSCRPASSSCPGAASAQRIQVEARRALSRGRICESFRARASTTSRSSAPTGRRRSTSGRACSACRSSSSSPISTTPRESHLYFEPGDGRLITVFTNEERTPDPTPHRRPTRAASITSRSRSRRPSSTRRWSGSTSAAITHSGVKDRGFMDSIYFEDPLGLTIELASYRFEPPAGFSHRRRAAGGAQAPRRAGRPQHRPGAPGGCDRGCSCGARASRCPMSERTSENAYREGGNGCRQSSCNVLKPSVNNLTRADLRARRRARCRGGRRLGHDDVARVPRRRTRRTSRR